MTACKFVASDQPRVIVGRHDADCPEDGCKGCQPCEERHCAVCVHTHAEGTCAECVAAARDDLRQIAVMCGSLPAEAEHRGVHGEAMMLLAPAADPEAWRNRAMSVATGRLCRHPRGVTCPDRTPKPEGPACRKCKHRTCLVVRDDVYRCEQRQGFIDDCRDEAHPLYVLGSWEQVWRDHLEQPTDLRATLPRLVDYLDRQMHVMAAEGDVPFEDFARDLRGCRGHLQAVLSDQNQGDRANIGCFDCGGRLERKLTKAGFEDHWTCGRCRRKYTYAEYNFALRAALEETA